MAIIKGKFGATSISNDAKIERALKEAAKIGKTAAVRALNDAAFRTRKAIQQRMDQIFNYPTPWIKNNLLYKKADIKDASPKASLAFRDESTSKRMGYNNPAETILPQVRGGASKPTNLEDTLVSKGIMPKGMHIVPGRGLKLNKYGNIRPGDIVRILSALKLFNDQRQNLSERSKAKQQKFAQSLFVINAPRPRLNMGIWERRKGGIRLLIKFINAPDYKVKFNFEKECSDIFDKELIKQINYQLSKSGGSAGPSSDAV
jgi:hypothetical protein